MRKFTGIFFIAALTAAAVGISGCSGCSSGVKNTAALGANWYITPGYRGMQPPFMEENGSVERAEYSVVYDGSSANNSAYSLEFANGVYTTEFTGKTFDYKTYTYEDYRQDFADELTSDGAEKPFILYYFKSEFKTDVTFKYGGAEATFAGEDGDSVISECYFRTTGDGLLPVYSRQSVVSHSPRTQRPSSLENSYELVEREVVTSYDIQCKHAARTVTENGESNTTVVKVGGDCFFDATSVYIVARAMALEADSSQNIDLFIPATGAQGEYTVAGTDADIGAEAYDGIRAIESVKNALGTQIVTKDDGTESEELKPLEYISANIVYSGELSGTAQTVWYAKVSDETNNPMRAAMLKIRAELPYGLGALNYTLTDISFAKC